MTNTENIAQYGNNAYGKPATALNILRETVMGRELFDYAFKEYCTRWAFKHPAPADFFRTMEDASGVDLDWFWRGWFYDIQPVDISLDSVIAFTVDSPRKVLEGSDTVTTRKTKVKEEFLHVSRLRNKQAGMTFLVDKDTTLRDFYYYYKPEPVTKETTTIKDKYENLSLLDKEEFKKYENKFYYELNFSNKGGLVMPIIVQWNYKDGTSETEYISAYIWRKDEQKVTKTFAKDKEVVAIKIDPFKETADIDENNNSWPKIKSESRFDLYKTKVTTKYENKEQNPMQKKLSEKK